MELWRLDLVGGFHLRDGTELKCLTASTTIPATASRHGSWCGRQAWPACVAIKLALRTHSVTRQVLRSGRNPGQFLSAWRPRARRRHPQRPPHNRRALQRSHARAEASFLPPPLGTTQADPATGLFGRNPGPTSRARKTGTVREHPPFIVMREQTRETLMSSKQTLRVVEESLGDHGVQGTSSSSPACTPARCSGKLRPGRR